MIPFSVPFSNSRLSGSGIYAIENLVDGRVYVGSAVAFYRRFAKHRACLRHGYHPNPYLQSAFNLIGDNGFCFKILEECEKDLLLERENHWIKMLQSQHDARGYNFLPVAGSRRGSICSDATKEKIGSSLKKLHQENPQIAKAAGAKRRGRRPSPQHIAKIAAKCSKPFSLRGPDGVIYTGNNYAEFCRARGLSKSAICQILHDNPVHHSHKGWTKA